MHLLQRVAVLLALFQCCFSQGTKYVANVNCSSKGIAFTFSEDSDLYRETKLEITLYTGADNKQVAYTAGTESVDIDYKDYDIQSVTVYGPANRPLMYNIEQPFYAVPLPGSGSHRNYTFGVYCMVTAYDNVNISTNTTDNGHGDHGGGTITPQDHVENILKGVDAYGGSTIGDKLQYILELKDDTYAALMPVSCKYFNPSNEVQNLPFVSDSCPRVFPDDPDEYFGTIKKLSQSTYQVDFRAFTFEAKPDSYLGIDCDLLLCITTTLDECKKQCWGDVVVPTTTAAIGTTTGAVETTTGPTGAVGTTTVGAETTTGAGATTTGAAQTTTEAAATTTEAPITTTVAPPPRVRRMVARFHPIVKRDTTGTGLKDNPDATTTTINDKKIMRVNLPGVDPNPSSTSICTDSSLLSALYAVIGILAILVAVLVGSLSYIACARRRQATKADHYYDGPYVPSIAK